MHSAFLRRDLPIIALVICAALIPVGAQGVLPATDTIFRRAKKLVADGNGVAGRALVDSVLRGAAEGSAGYGDALYWRGALAETAADAERDYRRVIVEYPLSAYVDNALLAMADLETARGDRAGALLHLQRFVKEHATTAPVRGTAALSAARLAFEQRDMRTGCAMVSAARVSTPSTNVEARNQIDYLSTRCAGVDLAAVPVQTPATAPVSTGQAPAQARDTSARVSRNAPESQKAMPASPKNDTMKTREKPVVATAPRSATAAASTAVAPTSTAVAPPPATAPRAQAIPREAYTIQLAAYNTRADAEQLVTKLKSKGVSARISGDAKPFRVRLEFYPTRQAAQSEVTALRARGIVGFVTTELPPVTAAP
jgi:cell division protein FtsN